MKNWKLWYTTFHFFSNWKTEVKSFRFLRTCVFNSVEFFFVNNRIKTRKTLRNTQTCYITLFVAPASYTWAIIHPYMTFFRILLILILLTMKTSLLSYSETRTKYFTIKSELVNVTLEKYPKAVLPTYFFLFLHSRMPIKASSDFISVSECIVWNTYMKDNCDYYLSTKSLFCPESMYFLPRL